VKDRLRDIAATLAALEKQRERMIELIAEAKAQLRRTPHSTATDSRSAKVRRYGKRR
jgi:hypothetical protein